MNMIKNVIQNQFKTLSLISVALVFSAMSLLVRIKLNKSFFYLFLIWNVFLAIIPYAITMYLSAKKNVSKLTLGFGFLVWLAFLPNAPYIITDLIHLRTANNTFLWLDIIVVLSFALSGLFLFYLSVIDMQNLLTYKFENLPIKTITTAILFLWGFGVYLGRFLRYNSWEIISGPHILFKDIVNIIIAPFQHYEAWLFTTGFGMFLVVGFWMFQNLNTLENN
ncbi:DUF1361 domain-containing protein [Winogradskyella endarachnes]|uniref:DUF1361 domain-containing protein n=1 Tax=Winogradskyella endarachnes TaxID=2681965 RepID=A0A6L6UFN7_9FLAO|nr:DUF1361 domain-containing protein [Winogradskyella endarachnes]MUU79674.1 DUF1361 domain-containing protein [Winogradskyella endarachnes]